MKKYLLLFLMCVYASIGAWAQDSGYFTENGATTNNSEGASSWVYDGASTLTITLAKDSHLHPLSGWSSYSSAGAPWASYNSSIKKIVFNTTSTSVTFPNDFFYALNIAETFDFSSLSASQITSLYSTTSNFDHPNITGVLKNVIVPEGSAAAPNGYNTLMISDGVVSGYFKKGVDQIDWSVIGGTPTTLKWKENVTSVMTISSAAITNLPSTITTLDFTEVSVNAMVTVDTPITTVYVADETSKNNISGENITIQMTFSGALSVNVTANDDANVSNLQSAITTALTSYTGATISDITSLTITGTLNDADLTYISNLTNLTTLNLSGVTSAVSSLTSSSLTSLTLPSNATALPNNIATNLPNLTSSIYVYSYSNNQLNSLDAYLITGDLSNLIEDLKTKTTSNLQYLTASATVKIRGALNSSDVSTANTYFNGSSTLDYSEATGITVNDITGTHEIIKLPANSTMPTDAQGSAWTGSGGYGKMIVYSLSSDGQTLSIWSNFAVENNNTTGMSLYSVVTEDAIDNKVGDYTGVQYVHIVGRNTSSPFENDFSSVITALEGKKIGLAKDPIEYSDCKVTINLASRGTKTMSELISEAETELAKSSKTICTLIVTGELSTTDLASLDDASTATRIDLSGATLASGASVDNIQVPTTLLSLVLPPNNTVSSTLETELAKATNFEYVYSETSNNGATVPTYVWIAKTGVMAHVFQNESSLTSAVYLKVAAKSGVSLDQNSVDLSETGMNSLQFLDVSESGLTTAAAPYYKAPHYNPYRIILPNNWSGDDMATFAANKNVGAIAAVYSYHGTTLKIMEINDASYSQAALADPRIMRSGTTEVDVVSGYYDGTTYAQFGTNLLAALNNMGKSEFSVTTKDANNNDVVTNYTNTLGQSVKTISIETTSAAPNALTFDNPSITTLKAENLVQNNAELNVSACSALTSLSVKGSNLKSVTASGNTSITSADLSGTAIATTTNFNGATKLATFTTTSESIFNGNVDLTRSALTGFTSEARFGGNINFNASSSLASIDLSGATIASTSVVHIDKDATEATENASVIDALKVSATKTIKLPSSFPTDAVTLATRIHPYAEAAEYIEVASTVAPAYNITTTDMTFHDKEAGDNTDHYRYWYMGAANSQKILTLGTSDSRRLSDAISEIPGNQNYSTTQYAKIKVVGPLTSADITELQNLNCTALDLSEATYGGSTVGETIGDLLKASFSTTLGVHSNVKFIALPDSCTRDYILNGDALKGLKNSVYCVIAVNETSDGKDLTSYSFQSGSLQPAVVAFQNSAANSWTTLSTGTTPTTKYTSTVSNFKKLKISGLINSYDLSKADQKLDADGHLSWAEDVVESTAQTRTLNGAYNVYGPFSSCYLLTEIDLRDAYFEPKSTGVDTSVYFRYWYSDMTLSFLDIISTATYKVVIPQNSKVREIPADFMRCSTNIRAICIPSNIQAIRTRAFYTIDYVWTTADAYATGSTTADPEGNNTRLDNGAKLSDGTPVKALIYEHGKYKENPEFENSYYTADYSGVDGGGTYTFGSTLKLIETGAFANTQPNVSDVYVLNTTAPECHVDAFNSVMYTGNGGYNSAKVSSEGIITRDAYYNGRWIAMLHYPRQTTDPQIQRYTDPTRDYSIATGMRDGKGATLYLPNQSEFIRAYQQGTYGYVWNAWNPAREYGSVNNGDLTNTTSGWTAENQSTANELFDAYTTGGDNHQYTSFYKVSDFTETVTAPTTTIVPYYNVNWSGSAYTTGDPGNLYPRSEKDPNIGDADNSGEMTTKDYRGWHQFVLNAYAANTVLEEEPYRSYITDNEWWTICPTFDITREECAILFGQAYGINTSGPSQYPYVSKLRYVRRFYGDGKGTITLNFTENLAEKKENRYQPTDKHGHNNSAGYVEILNDTPKSNDVVMSAGVPYLIKPNMGASPKRQFRIFKTEQDLQSFIEQFTTEEWENRNFVAFAHASLYDKIKAAQAENGATQIQHIHDGMYTVPVFVSESDGSGLIKENVETVSGTPTPYYPTGETSTYYKSTDWVYTFVGTFYKSFLPHYCYYLGWDSSLNSGNGGARFFYLDGEKGKPGVFTYYDNNMNWNNETGVICPTYIENGYTTAESRVFNHDVTPAHERTPAQWIIDFLVSDSFTVSSGSQGAKTYEMVFGAPDMIADNSEVTGISNIDANNSSDTNSNADVYTINGQKVGTSLEGLPKGIYIVNGKKFIVK